MSQNGSVNCPPPEQCRELHEKWHRMTAEERRDFASKWRSMNGDQQQEFLKGKGRKVNLKIVIGPVNGSGVCALHRLNEQEIRQGSRGPIDA